MSGWPWDQEAAREFTRALKMDPEHTNAGKYLAAVTAKIQAAEAAKEAEEAKAMGETEGSAKGEVGRCRLNPWNPLKAPGTALLKLRSDGPLSNVAFNLNLRRFSEGTAKAEGKAKGGGKGGGGDGDKRDREDGGGAAAGAVAAAGAGAAATGGGEGSGSAPKVKKVVVIGASKKQRK